MEKFDPGKKSDDAAFPLTRFEDLEEEVAGNGEDIRSIREILQKQHDSYEGFKRGYMEDRKVDGTWRIEMSRELGRMAGSIETSTFWIKVLAGLLSATLAALVALVALAIRR